MKHHVKKLLSALLCAALMIQLAGVLPMPAAAASRDEGELAAETAAAEINENTVWRYLDDGTDPAGDSTADGYERTSWTTASFDDSSWKTGTGSFGAKKGAIAALSSTCTPKTLLTQYKEDGSTDIEAFFFRTTVTIADANAVTAITGSILYDDAAIVYLNGVQIAAFDADSITANIQYGGSNDGDPRTGTINVTDTAILANLKTGENVISVELHQGRSSSSDIYMDFTELTFSTEKAVVEQNSISLSVGSDETEMNFTWYASSETAGTIYVAKASELVDGAMPESAQTVTAAATESNKSGFYSNQATVTGLEENTKYAYQLKNGDTVSEIYEFTTGDSDAFTFLLVGDPQLGASHDVNSDSSGWSETLAAATQNVSDAAFILSVGDQVNTASNEEEYSAYLEQEELYGIPVATVIGNHDSSSDSYSQHFNIANESANGQTTAGGDYWFRYGDVLFLVLNVNNMSTAEHKEFMQAAIYQNQDATWKIVAMHHSVYSVASHALDSSILQRREQLVPVFEELDIDVVLQGHDHVYCRSYMMDGLTPVTDASEYDDETMTSVTNTDDILYITANSASGSKYYSIQTNLEFPYAAVMNQEHTQNYSAVSVSDSAFTITTYRTSDGSVVDTFSIYRMTEEKTVSVEADDITMTYTGSVVPDSAITGTATVDGVAIDGVWSFRDTAPTNVADSGEYVVVFTPADTDYAAVETTIQVTITRAASADESRYTVITGSGANTATRYTVTTSSDTEHGDLTVSTRRAAAGETVTITASPEESYTVKNVTVVDKNGNAVTVTENSDGTYSFVMPAGSVTVSAEFSAITESAGETAETDTTPFTDISDNLFKNAIAYCYGAGLMEGTGATTFEPDAELTRAMVVTVVYRLSGSPIVTQASPFSDVAAGQWYSDAVTWAAANGVVTGYTTGAFGPNDPVTREQLAAILYRYASAQGASVSETYPLDGFSDSATVSSYAVTPVMWAMNNGILVSRTAAKLDARESATRAEVANALMALCESVLQ